VREEEGTVEGQGREKRVFIRKGHVGRRNTPASKHDHLFSTESFGVRETRLWQKGKGDPGAGRGEETEPAFDKKEMVAHTREVMLHTKKLQ